MWVVIGAVLFSCPVLRLENYNRNGSENLENCHLENPKTSAHFKSGKYHLNEVDDKKILACMIKDNYLSFYCIFFMMMKFR